LAGSGGFTTPAKYGTEIAYAFNMRTTLGLTGEYNYGTLASMDELWKSEYWTKEEYARLSKFNSIYMNAYKEYEAEHGQVPYKPVATVKGTAGNMYSPWAAYNPQAYPSMYNFLA
jgi:hypothetical protein